jgi:5-methyltetrahydropteroyltriglutamate--homocysteine methyltransferase
MRTSTDRILTTHVGSLPRTQAVTDVIFAREKGDVADAVGAARTITQAVHDVVGRQREVGIDVVSDGEMSKISYATYVAERLSGFDGDTPREPGQDLLDFPRLLKKLADSGATAKYRRPRCVGPIAVKNLEPLRVDVDNLRAAVSGANGAERS